MVLHDEGSEAHHAAGDGFDPATAHGYPIASLCIVDLSLLVPPIVQDPASRKASPLLTPVHA